MSTFLLMPPARRKIKVRRTVGLMEDENKWDYVRIGLYSLAIAFFVRELILILKKKRIL